MYKRTVVRAETKVLDATAGRVHAVVSTETKDRHGDIIRQDGWDLKAFMEHPILLSSHDYISLRSQIGEWEQMQVVGSKENHRRLEGIAVYYIGRGNEEANWAYQLASLGRAAFSVGFRPDMAQAKELPVGDDPFPHWEFRGQELLEVSQVSIPANPQALQQLRTLSLDPAIADIVDEVLRAEPKLVITKHQLDFDELLVALHYSGLALRAAIRPHTSPKADEGAEWDAGAEVKKAEGASQLRRMHAWVDSDDDPDNKGAYKLPHHRADGTAVWRGVSAAMAALMGGRGGVDIPDSDRRGVYNHLTRHYELWDKDPPEFKAIEELAPSPVIKLGDIIRNGLKTGGFRWLP